MPLEGQRLVIEPTYPKAKELSAIGNEQEDSDPEDATRKIRNRFWSQKKGRDIVIVEDTITGKIDWGTVGGVNHFGHDLQTLGCSVAWGIEQERNALDLLGSLVRHHTFKQYLLTGMFLESSERSGVTYVFRKLRPTIAVNAREGRILAALCMHPIGYYEGSWAGAMTPTDDVISHLILMRGDEHMFWRRCNQHAPWRAEAGL